MARFDLTDFEFALIRPLLPDKPRGVTRVDDRRVRNGIFRVLLSRRRQKRGRITPSVVLVED